MYLPNLLLNASVMFCRYLVLFIYFVLLLNCRVLFDNQSSVVATAAAAVVSLAAKAL